MLGTAAPFFEEGDEVDAKQHGPMMFRKINPQNYEAAEDNLIHVPLIPSLSLVKLMGCLNKYLFSPEAF